MIKDVNKAVQSTGLMILSTVVDQAPSNVAINSLNYETNIKYLKAGKENCVFGFESNDGELIPIFDVPHLFKGLRNNLLTKDLHVSYENKNEIAFWKHVIQFYELDKEQSTQGDRPIPKLIDAHIYLKE